MNANARFTHMKDGTQEDWAIIAADFSAYARQLPSRIVAHLKLLEGDFGGFPVDRLTHSLQTATRAWRDGRDEEYVVCALLHDIGDTLGSYNHPDIAAAILKPFVSAEICGWSRSTGSFRATTSSITWAWIGTCASNSRASAVPGDHRVLRQVRCGGVRSSV
jgi:predicted HD phosphohydrolase